MPRFDAENIAQVEKAVDVTSVLLWLPHAACLLYTCIDAPVTVIALNFVYMGAIMAATFFTASRTSGDALTVVMWAVGISSEFFSIGTSASGAYGVSRNVWLVASALHGLFSGMFCKAKDIADGRYFEGHTFAERLYIVTPFTVGIWTAHIFMEGFGGIFDVYRSIFFCLALVGWSLIGYRVVSYSGVLEMDPITIVNKIFTSSFGVVFMSMLLLAVTGVYLAIPFASSLLYLNGLVSSVGVVVELIVYDFV